MSTTVKCRIITDIRTKVYARDASQYRTFTVITSENRIAFCSVKEDNDLKNVEQNAYVIIANCETSTKADKMFVNIFGHTKVVMFIVLTFASMCIITFITMYCYVFDLCIVPSYVRIAY